MTTIDLSNGIVLTDEERYGTRAAVADMNAKESAAEKRLAVLAALHVVKAGLPALGLLGPAGVALAAILEIIIPKTDGE